MGLNGPSTGKTEIANDEAAVLNIASTHILPSLRCQMSLDLRKNAIGPRTTAHIALMA
jgi:hypothetical protein